MRSPNTRSCGKPAFARDKLRLVLVRDRAVRQDHAVLAARLDDRWLILDNRRSQLIEDTDASNFTPLFAINHDGVHLFAAPYAKACAARWPKCGGTGCRQRAGIVRMDGFGTGRGRCLEFRQPAVADVRGGPAEAYRTAELTEASRGARGIHRVNFGCDARLAEVGG